MDSAGVSYAALYPARAVTEAPSITLDEALPQVFSEHAVWNQPEAFVATLPNARVWGRRGATMTSDNLLLGDVSREFGAYKGVYNEKHSIFRQVLLPPPREIEGTVAVAAVPGSATFFHWMFDVLPRIHLLQKSGMFESVDRFILDYEGLGFQRESLNAINLPTEKLLLPGNHWDFHVRANRLIVPSLTGELGTIAGWVVQFLRDTFLGKSAPADGSARRRLFVSRRKAPSRRELNYDELLGFLQDRGFEEYIAEDRSIAETARDFASAEWIVGLHGGGMANLAFASPGTKVIEFLPPRHVDSLFWILSNHVNARHGYLFAEGDYPQKDADIVKDKVDLDVVVSVDKLRKLFDLMSDS